MCLSPQAHSSCYLAMRAQTLGSSTTLRRPQCTLHHRSRLCASPPQPPKHTNLPWACLRLWRLRHTQTQPHILTHLLSILNTRPLECRFNLSGTDTCCPAPVQHSLTVCRVAPDTTLLFLPFLQICAREGAGTRVHMQRLRKPCPPCVSMHPHPAAGVQADGTGTGCQDLARMPCARPRRPGARAPAGSRALSPPQGPAAVLPRRFH